MPGRHLYLYGELLTKVFNHLTTRSHVFAVVDRSALAANPGPQPRFDPRAVPSPGCADGSVVLHLSIIH